MLMIKTKNLQINFEDANEKVVELLDFINHIFFILSTTSCFLSSYVICINVEKKVKRGWLSEDN